MGQNQSHDSSQSYAASSGNSLSSVGGNHQPSSNKGTDDKKSLHPALVSGKKAELSNSKEGGSDRSIHWAETIATDIEKTGASHDKNEHFDKKQRVRARSEEDFGGKKFSQSDELSLVSLGSEQTSGTFGSEHFADDEISEFEAVLVRELKKRVERQHNQESP